MLKTLSQLECKIAEKVIHLVCDHDTPLEHVKEALFQFLKYVGQIEDAVKASQSSSEESKIEIINEDNHVG